MIKLVSNFLNSAGKKHTLNIKDPNTDLSPAKVKQSLQLLTTLDIFEKDGVELFQEVVSAKYVETIETPVFTGDEFFGEANQPVVLNQSMLAYAPTTSVLEVPEVTIEAPVEEEKLDEVKAQSSYRAMPVAPQVSLDMPEKENLKEVPAANKLLEEAPETRAKAHTSSNYPISEILRRRRNRKKAQEQQKKNLD